MSRRALLAVILLVVAAGLGFLIMQFGTGSVGTDDAATADAAAEDVVPPDEPVPPTSEALIAEALDAGDLTYEESLLQRAYALYDDPRLEPAFRSSIVNWEALGPLLDEIADKEATLSPELLDDLLPFRVRPNDPRSILNRPREEIVRTQAGAGLGWEGLDVPGTRLMVWIQGTPQDLPKYAAMAGQIWKAFPPYFTYPLSDAPGLPGPAGTFNSHEVNPNNKVDIYLIDTVTADPRLGSCQDCSLGANAGWAKEDPSTSGARTGSGYVLLNKGGSNVADAMAHELAHVAQRAYDWDETRGGETWMPESTATWVAYMVMKALRISRVWEYRLLDRRTPPPPGQPRWPAPPLFNNLHRPLHRTGNDYSGFLFFYYASQALGDGIVKLVWQQASARGPQGIDAVDQAIRLVDHFPRFTVRNWNHDYLPIRYKDDDGDFPEPLVPEPVREMPSDLGLFELGDPVVNLSARYYRFQWPDAKVRKVTFQNLYRTLPDAHVWAIRKIGADWKDPEDWSRNEQVELCRDSPNEHVTELMLVVSDSHPRQPIPPGHPKPRVLVEDVGCEFLEGWAQSTLRLKDDVQDVTYTSSRAALRFKPRTVQDQQGNVQYDLMPTAVTWTVSGTRHDCRLTGQAVVAIPAYLDQPLDPTRPAWGYLNVVGRDGGDFHSVEVSAVDQAARMTVTCPGDPPIVTREPFGSVWLLHVLTEKNTHTGNAVVFQGKQTFDPARIQDNIPVGPAEALSSIPGSFLTPEAQRALKEAQAALDRRAAEESGKMVYTFEWELKPMTGAPPLP